LIFRSLPALKAVPVPVRIANLIAESASVRSNSSMSRSRSSACSRFRDTGPVETDRGAGAVAFENQPARGPRIHGELHLLVLLGAPLGLGVDGPGEIGMACHEQAEVDKVQQQEL